MHVSIVALIYKSPWYADSTWESLYKNTPHLLDGRADFFFVANDATPTVIEHLNKRRFPYVIQTNEVLTEAQLFASGIGWPEYIHRVYCGWNRAITSAKGDVVVLVNSDMVFSPDWLDNLLKHLTDKTYVCSQLVERNHPKYGVFPGAYCANFGSNPGNFKLADFLKFCDAAKTRHEIRPGGAYMPACFYKQVVIDAGLFPEGNLHDGTSFRSIAEYGDQHLVRVLAEQGVRHITAMDSIVYHFKEAEMETDH